MINPWSSAGMRSQEEYARGTAWVPAELTGWRRWVLKPEGLTGSFGQPWTADTMDAQCLARHEVEISRDRYDTLRARNNHDVFARIDGGDPYRRTVYGKEIPDDVNARFYENVRGKGHAAPHHNPGGSDDCQCGIYAGYSYGQLQSHWATNPSTTWIGVVKASGRTICGQSGFRTARARIVALCVGLDDANRDLLAQGRATVVRVSPAGLTYATGTPGEPEERIAEVERNRRRDLAGFPAYAGVELFADLREMQEAFPPDDLSALGVSGDAA